ncbi:ribonuclease H [Trifolium pratense]|uniref:Ribonuclease H n=1 Tax=Trifolium pratense TaxID=57577 RepID=A0A2K3P8E8_TRIPR|nr:ribonuclease H [Trifolium pratense]
MRSFVVNEVIDLAKKTGKECLVLIVDFEKAYDSVDCGSAGCAFVSLQEICVMRKAVQEEMFVGFAIRQSGMVISHMQYANDALCIGEATVQNLWTIKAILRGFEMASGLKVNFWKSSLMGINVPEDFMVMASTFLNCKYLGLPVVASPRRISTWKPLLG